MKQLAAGTGLANTHMRKNNNHFYFFLLLTVPVFAQEKLVHISIALFYIYIFQLALCMSDITSVE